MTIVADKARRDSALWSGAAAWAGGRLQAAGVAAEENGRVGSTFPVVVSATMSAARESHPHGVKRSASPDDDVNNNGGVVEGCGLPKIGIGGEGWMKTEEALEVT